MPNPVVHFELMSSEPDKVCSFYQKIFGWKIQAMPEMNSNLVNTEAQRGINGGIFRPPQTEPWPNNTTLYIDVDDLAAYCKRVVEAGGKICVEEQEVPGMGWFSLFLDPDGRMMGLWKTAKMQSSASGGQNGST